MIASSITAAYVYFNALTALMLILGAAFSLYIYTVWLKRITPWNVVIGGFAGCFAALSGWTAAVNMLSGMPMLIALLDFLWTPGHLWGLAIKKIKEYRAAGVPMLPVKVGIHKASKVVFWLNVGTVATSLLFSLLQLSGAIYIAVALAAGAIFLFRNRGLLTSPSEAYGFQVFAASMPYLMCLMLGLIIDKIFIF
jgi:protoheme IX farnesyltransferase